MAGKDVYKRQCQELATLYRHVIFVWYLGVVTDVTGLIYEQEQILCISQYPR